ncbi:MAG: GFA family protein [Pseudomonadales bacterium]|nr:GFA family protein [Pseudomonadales bacterium]
MITGERFCAETSYELAGSLDRERSCHCSRCRKAFSGAASAYAELVPGCSIRWTAKREPATYNSNGEWSIGFCSNCGSTLCGLRRGEVHGPTLGCANGDPGVEIEMHIFVGSKAPWDHIGGEAPQFMAFPIAERDYN